MVLSDLVMELGGYLIIAVTLVLTLIGIYLMLYLENKFSAKHDEKWKNDTYECGEVTVGDAKGPIHVQYYFVVLMFVIFDVATALIIPWAFTFTKNATWNFAFPVLIFFAIMLVALYYAIKEGYLEWR